MAKACCCIGLPTAGLVISILSLTISFINTFYLIAVTIDPKSDAPWRYLKTKEDTMVFIGILSPLILSIVVSFLLLLGIILKRANFLLPWLIVFIIYETIRIFATVITIYKICDNWKVYINIPIIFVEVYTVNVILSLYRDLKANPGNKVHLARV